MYGYLRGCRPIESGRRTLCVIIDENKRLQFFWYVFRDQFWMLKTNPLMFAKGYNLIIFIDEVSRKTTNVVHKRAKLCHLLTNNLC
jgi:hypothetical protein